MLCLLPPVTHDAMLCVARGDVTKNILKRPPTWVMRQAGRYLPEFLALRSYNFLERVHTPELATEITLQPLRRYIDRLDAVVIFSDILIVPPAMGLPVSFKPGPQFTRLLESPKDLDTLNWNPSIKEHFGWLLEAITLTRRLAAAIPNEPFAYTPPIRTTSPENDKYCLPSSCLPENHLLDMESGRLSVGKAVPVIGFVGAPWTLMSYMIDGDLEKPSGENAIAEHVIPIVTTPLGTSGSRGLVGHKTYERSKKWLYNVCFSCSMYFCIPSFFFFFTIFFNFLPVSSRITSITCWNNSNFRRLTCCTMGSWC